MMRPLLRLVIAAAAALSLAACSTTPAGTSTIMFGLAPVNELGYEVDTSGAITIEGRNMQFRNYAGMPLAYVTGYRVDYYNSANTLIGRTSTIPQPLNFVVPPGFQCEEPDPVIGCASAAVRTQAPGPVASVEGMGNQLLNVDIAMDHIAAGYPSGWFARVTIYGHNAYGAFEDQHIINIVAPN